MCALNTSLPSGESPSEVMLRLISGFSVARALYVALKLGIPDLLQDQAQSAVELAEATEMHAPSLYRMLCMLVSVGVLRRDEQDRFTLTAVEKSTRPKGDAKALAD